MVINNKLIFHKIFKPWLSCSLMPKIRPLETKESAEKKKNRNAIVIGIVIAAIMVFSTVGFAILESYSGKQQSQGYGNQTTYRNYQFVRTEAGWQTLLKISDKDIAINTFYLPQELENLSSQGKPLVSDFVDKKIFIIASSNIERQDASEYNILGDFALRIQIACSKENENTSFCLENNLPIKSCDDVDYDTAIIMLQELNDTGTEASVNYKNSCLVVKGNSAELLKATDKSILMIFGIME